MARIRTIKPEYWTSGKQLRLSLEAAFLLPSLWNHADDEGRLVDDELEIGARCPRLYGKVEAYLKELHENDLIIRYSVDGKKYIQIHDWSDHQSIQKKKESKIPSLQEEDIKESNAENTEAVVLQEEYSSHTVSVLWERKEGKEGNGKEGKEGTIPEKEKKLLKESKPPPSTRIQDDIQEIFNFWQSERDHPKAKLDDDRKSKIKARLKEGYSKESIIQAVRGIRFSAHHMGENDTHTVYDDIELICRSGTRIDRFAELEVKYGTDKKHFREVSQADRDWIKKQKQIDEAFRSIEKHEFGKLQAGDRDSNDSLSETTVQCSSDLVDVSRPV